MLEKLRGLVPSEKTRAYLYSVSTAVLALAGVYGLVDGNQAAAWTLAASAITGMARVNTSTKKPGGKHRAA